MRTIDQSLCTIFCICKPSLHCNCSLDNDSESGAEALASGSGPASSSYREAKQSKSQSRKEDKTSGTHNFLFLGIGPGGGLWLDRGLWLAWEAVASLGSLPGQPGSPKLVRASKPDRASKPVFLTMFCSKKRVNTIQDILFFHTSSLIPARKSQVNRYGYSLGDGDGVLSPTASPQPLASGYLSPQSQKSSSVLTQPNAAALSSYSAAPSYGPAGPAGHPTALPPSTQAHHVCV